MISNPTDPRYDWLEEDSVDFIQYAPIFVPEREIQFETILSLLPDKPELRVVDLCAGDGFLTEQILSRRSSATVIALERSPKMLQAAKERLICFDGRAHLSSFDLKDQQWRGDLKSVDCFVSSMAIHHLAGIEKALLFKDLFRILKPEGRLIVADLIQPETEAAQLNWAKSWDDTVRNQSIARFGDERAFDAFRELRWNHFAELEPDPIDQPSPLYLQLHWLEEAGFAAIDVHWVKAGHAVFSADRLT